MFSKQRKKHVTPLMDFFKIRKFSKSEKKNTFSLWIDFWLEIEVENHVKNRQISIKFILVYPYRGQIFESCIIGDFAVVFYIFLILNFTKILII